MVEWRRAIYRTLKKYDRLCSINNCNNTKTLHKDLSLLIEDLRKMPQSINEQDKLFDAVKNAGVCIKCGFSNDRVRDAYNILILVRTASKLFDDLKKEYEKKLKKVSSSQFDCEKCQKFDIVLEDLAMAIAIAQTSSIDFVLQPSSKVNQYGIAATGICINSNNSCRELPFAQALLEDVAQAYIEKKEKNCCSRERVIETKPQRNSFLFEDEQIKMARICNNETFIFIVTIEQLIPVIKKLELEKILSCLSILKVCGCIDGDLDAKNLSKRWLSLFEERKLNKLEKEIRLFESAKIINSSSSSIYLYEKMDALEFLLQNSKKTKEEIVDQLKKKEKLSEGELFILKKIK